MLMEPTVTRNNWQRGFFGSGQRSAMLSSDQYSTDSIQKPSLFRAQCRGKTVKFKKTLPNIKGQKKLIWYTCAGLAFLFAHPVIFPPPLSSSFNATASFFAVLCFPWRLTRQSKGTLPPPAGLGCQRSSQLYVPVSLTKVTRILQLLLMYCQNNTSTTLFVDTFDIVF